jgi:adenosylhomocysteine nucleosidase
MRIGIIAALPGELTSLVGGWQRVPVANGSGIAMWQSTVGNDEVVAVAAGMGAAAARRAFTGAEYAGSLDAVYSIGWAGALVSECDAGEAFTVSEVVDVQTGERFATAAAVDGVRLVTTPQAVGQDEKRRLAASYGAAMVDMEAATVARLARMRDIPFHCVKAVSDGVDADLPDLNPFIDSYGKLRLSALLGYVALHPRYWGSIAQLGRTSAIASRSLAVMVRSALLTGGGQV